MTAGAGAPQPADEDRSRIRLNVGLYVATLVLACVAGLLGYLIHDKDVEVRFWTADFWSGEKALAERPGDGADVGSGVVEAVEQAPEEEQDRIGEQVATARTLVEAFANLDHQDPAASMDVVRSLATGDFLEQYEKGAIKLEELALEAQSTMVSQVVWTGLVAGDDDSATVIVATTGTVKNKTTKFEEESVNYRIQVQLVRDGDTWLANDLQFVELG